MSKIPLIISYYANNKGTTDYLIDYLKDKKAPFYYLKHPLPEMEIGESKLYLFDGKNEKCIKTYKTSRNFLVKTLAELSLNFLTSLRLLFKQESSTVVGFGSLNAFTLLYLRLFNTKVIFWGVDYSPKRFGSAVLDRIYYLTETFGCLFASMVIQPTEKQLRERVNHHHLKKSKALIIPNGIDKLDIPFKVLKKDQRISFLYIGSVTAHHGVLSFIKTIYGEGKAGYPLTIFGDGSDMRAVSRYIKDHKLDNLITVKGSRHPNEIKEYVIRSKDYLVGVAPYVNGTQSHVSFGDSLKLKEYINLGIPFISSDAVILDEQLKKLGFIYRTNSELEDIINNLITSTDLSNEEKQVYLNTLDWKYLFSTHEKVTSL